MEQEVAAETDPAQKRLKQGFLTAMKERVAAQSVPSSTRTPSPSSAGANQDPWDMPARREEPKGASQQEVARNASVQQWENNKASVVRAMKSTMTQAELERFGTPDSTAMESDIPASMRGKTSEEKMDAWIQENADKLGITPKDGGKLTAKSVVFVDHTGRGVKMSEVIRAVIADPRFKQNRPSEVKTTSGNTAKVTVGKLKEVE
jgi:hypothetical protein